MLTPLQRWKQHKHSGYNLIFSLLKVGIQAFFPERDHDFLPQVQLFGSEEIQNWCKSCGVSVDKYLKEDGHTVMKMQINREDVACYVSSAAGLKWWQQQQQQKKPSWQRWHGEVINWSIILFLQYELLLPQKVTGIPLVVQSTTIILFIFII